MLLKKVHMFNKQKLHMSKKYTHLCQSQISFLSVSDHKPIFSTLMRETHNQMTHRETGKKLKRTKSPDSFVFVYNNFFLVLDSIFIS